MNLQIDTMPKSTAAAVRRGVEMTRRQRVQGSHPPERDGKGEGMSLARTIGEVLTSALLAAAVSGAALGAPSAQAGAAGQVRFMESPSEAMAAAQRRRAREAHRLQRLRLERAAAHARMPDTMYASTPDGATPPHPLPLDVPLPLDARSVLAAPAAAEASAVGTAPGAQAVRVHRIALFPAASRWVESGYRGEVRIVNRSAAGGEVRIEAFDDAGVRHGPVTLRIGAGEAVHIGAGELERGSGEKGLSGGIGTGEGDWRLEVASALDIEVLGYIRARDGLLSSVHGMVPEDEAGHRVVLFDPGRGVGASRLRVVNPGSEAAVVRIEGIDDAGEWSAGVVELVVPARGSRTLTARELETGAASGLAGALGEGTGRWRLTVTADRPVEVLSPVVSAAGHVSNASSVPGPVGSGAGGVGSVHAVAWFPSAARWRESGYQGVLRVVNRSGEGGEVRIEAFDDAGVAAGPVALALGAKGAVELSSGELEGGGAAKGLSEGIGTGEGDWRLRVSTGLEVVVLAYVRTQDGFLGTLHDVVPEGEAGHRVVLFRSGRSAGGASRLRVVNPGVEAALVRIAGVDDAGDASSGAVSLVVPAGASRTVGARELERGASGLGGALGEGSGRWRLTVTADRPVEVMNLLASPGGQVSNLSAAPSSVGRTETAAGVFAAHLSGPVVQGKCVACHVEGGVAGATRLRFVASTEANHETLNLRAFEEFIGAVDDGAGVVLNKIQGVGHGGGVQVAAGTPEFADMERFLGLLGGDGVSPVAITPQTLFETVTMAPARKTLRRAALIFAGRIPTDAEYAAAQRGAAALRATIRGLMKGSQFHEFLARGANDRLLTDRNIGQIIDHNVGRYFVDFVNETYRRREAAHRDGKRGRYYDWNDRAQHGFRRAPVELIAHVAMNDRPYTEILTADYIMANPWAAEGYGARTRFEDSEDVHEFKPSRIVSYYREGEGFVSEFNRALLGGSTRIVDRGPLRTDYPHAGILNTTSFLLRYPTTATNRNRARSRWTYYHFLGLDIEKSASRTTDPVALADTNNPTMHNPACTICHTVLDPVAGTFQNYGDDGFYKDQWGGVDSLDRFYKKEVGGEERAVQAESWQGRETLSWPVWLAAGVQTLRVLFTNPVDNRDTDTGEGGEVYLDRLRVTDARGGVVASREFEDLGPPIRYFNSRPCGRLSRNPSGREDHVKLWWGDVECAFFMDVEVPSDGVYNVEIAAWSNGYIEQYGENGFARLSVATNGYQEGDTWYRDMREPGFAGELAPNPDNGMQWLAKQIAADERFAEATVKFWWPAITGSEVAAPPEDEEDADFEGLLLAANAQGAEVERLANGFRRGFHGGPAYNLKDLLVEMVLSPWFRADAVEDANPVRRIALRDAGARRLLTPEELARKTDALTGVRWERRINQGWPYLKWPSGLTHDYRLLYGGIDSDGVTQRARDLTAVMAGVAKRHAMQIACAVVTRDFYLRTGSEQRLLAGIDKYTTAPDAIRGKLMELHEKMLGVEVGPHSPDVERAYGLFADVLERKRAERDTRFEHWNCHAGAHDRFFFEGLLDDIVVENENEDGHRWYDFDWDRINRYLERIDWSDPHHTAQAWVVTLAYLLTDYRYLYL